MPKQSTRETVSFSINRLLNARLDRLIKVMPVRPSRSDIINQLLADWLTDQERKYNLGPLTEAQLQAIGKEGGTIVL